MFTSNKQIEEATFVFENNLQKIYPNIKNNIYNSITSYKQLVDILGRNPKFSNDQLSFLDAYISDELQKLKKQQNNYNIVLRLNALLVLGIVSGMFFLGSLLLCGIICVIPAAFFIAKIINASIQNRKLDKKHKIIIENIKKVIANSAIANSINEDASYSRILESERVNNVDFKSDSQHDLAIEDRNLIFKDVFTLDIDINLRAKQLLFSQVCCVISCMLVIAFGIAGPLSLFITSAILSSISIVCTALLHYYDSKIQDSIRNYQRNIFNKVICKNEEHLHY